MEDHDPDWAFTLFGRLAMFLLLVAFLRMRLVISNRSTRSSGASPAADYFDGLLLVGGVVAVIVFALACVTTLASCGAGA